MLEKNIRYKQVVRCQLYGDDDLYYKSASSQYTLLPFRISSIPFSGGSGYGTEAPYFHLVVVVEMVLMQKRLLWWIQFLIS